MCKRTLLLTSLVLVLGLVNVASATTFYCDPASGSMSNDGSSGSPWSTLQAVFDNNKIESRDQYLNTINSGAPVKAGDTIKLRTGNHGTIYESGGYYNTSNITVEAQSGHEPKLAGLEIRYAGYWTFRGITVTNGQGPTGNLISFGYNPHDIIVEDCYMYSEEDSSGWSSAQWNSVSSGLSFSGCEDCLAQDNYILNVDMGIFVSGSGTEIIGNTIENIAKDGIRGSGGNITLEDNTILNCYNVNDNHDDGIQWYSGPSGTAPNVTIRGTYVNDDTSNGTRNFIGGFEGIGCFDDYLTYWTVENNIMICNHWHGISLYNADYCTIANNTAYNPRYVAGTSECNTWISFFEGKQGGGGTGNTLVNNLMHSSTSGYNQQVDPSEASSYFVNTNPSSLDLHLKAGSDAIDAGTSSSAPSVDYDGVSRPQGSGYDVGAYEYVSGANDTTAPSPDPMTWATEPYATGTSSISMTATTATDTSGVEYYFDCTAGGGNDSGWQDSTTYEDTGLSASTQYTYQVKARDKSSNQNETAYSTTKSATTNAADTTAPSPDPMTWSTEPYATGTTSISMTATTATDTSGVEYYFDCTAGGGNDSGWQDSATYEDTGLSPSTQYTYQVRARDKSGNQNTTGWSTTKSATTDAEPEPNLVSWWKLDESSGTNADDSSGNNHDGTLSGGSWAPTSGKFDGAVDLGDNNTDYVQVPTTGMSASAGTVSVWGRIEGTQSGSRYFFGHTSGNWEDSIQLYMDNSDNNLDLGFGGVHPKHANIMTLSANTWYHIALTWDGTNYVVYIDGIEEASGTYTGLSTLNSIADIGNTGNTSWRTEAFQGLLDDVRIYDGALSKYDIEDLAGITIASSPSPADEATGVSTTADLSWSAGYYAASTNGHDVYLGTNYNAVADANHSSSEFKGTQSSTTYDPGTLSGSTTYYWSIDEVNDSNTWAGDVWSFTTSGGDTTAPSPDPMTWATEPYATGSTSISMTATTATDSSGVEYYFDCTAGGGNDSGWQDSTTYEDTGLSELTEYTYRVKARDKSANQNETAYSTTKSATTEDGTAPSPDPMTWATEPYATGSTSISMTATTATDTSGVEYYFDCTAGGGNDSGWQDSTTYEDTGLGELTEYTYRVKARDKSSNQNETAYSTTKSATTEDGTAPSPDPMTWATEPYSTGTTSILMTATTATDTSGVEYSFDCTAGGGNDSGWQDSTTYEDTGLSPSTQYTYKVQSRDKSSNQNTASWSTEKSATTDAAGGEPNLVSWWKLDESSGTNADDSSGNNHDGTRSGGSWAPTSGKFSGAVDLGDNNTDYVQVPTTGMSASAGTVSVWGRMEGTQSGTRYFFGHTSGNWEDSIQLYMDNSDNNLDLGFGGVHPKHANIMTLSANTWYHIALTWDGTNYVVYIDGIEEASGTYTGLSTLNSIADIGNTGNTSWRTEAFQGLLDDVGIYDQALSKYDIADLAGITIASSPSPADEATGVSTTADLSWSAGYYAADVNGHDVYLGTDYNSVADANHSSAEFKGTQSSTTYDPGTMSNSTTYYWVIDEVNDTNTWAGDIWSFTTILPDTNAPSPDPMTWATDPYATGSNSISMTATTATDTSGVEYYFDCTAGDGNDSGWQDSATYEDTGLSASTQYTYQVQARDKSANQNATGWSTEKSATTESGADPNLTGWWKLDETSGTTATDSSGNDYDGTVTGAAWDSNGYIDGALNFDGTSTYRCEVPSSALSVSAGTISLWGRLEGTQSGSRYFFGHNSDPNNDASWPDSIQLYMDDGNNQLDLGFGGVHPKHANITTLSTNTWYHIALTWDGTNYVVYVDGDNDANGTYTGLTTLTSFADIGNNGGRGSTREAFAGLIDDVRIYDRALSQSDVNDLAGE